jgi:glycerophosphoryl diester phosphodiesterase
MTKLQQRLTLALMATALLALLLVPGGAGASSGSASVAGRDKHAKLPIVIGHRGASGYRPEHTLASYQLAIEMGADYIEPDLVSTKDHVLVARHENNIKDTTNVADHPEFADREATKVIDGVSVSGWFTEDFTLAELMTLRAKERLPAVRPANTAFDGLYLVQALRANGYRGRNAPVFIQSFEVGNLQQLNRMTNVPLVQLIDATGKPYDFVVSGDPRTYADLVTPAGLAEIATYADGVGVNKDLIVPRDAQNRLLSPTTLIRDAHRAELLVHSWTFRRENTFLPEDFRQGNPASPVYLQATGDFPAELRLYYKLGLDGVFSDNSDVAVAVRHQVFARS